MMLNIKQIMTNFRLFSPRLLLFACFQGLLYIAKFFLLLLLFFLSVPIYIRYNYTSTYIILMSHFKYNYISLCYTVYTVESFTTCTFQILMSFEYFCSIRSVNKNPRAFRLHGHIFTHYTHSKGHKTRKWPYSKVTKHPTFENSCTIILPAILKCWVFF